MPTDSQLILLLQGDERERVEFKASERDRDDIKKTICAFANNLQQADSPLVLALGVSSQQGQIEVVEKGLPLTDTLSQLLSGFRDEGNILPRPSIEPRQVELRGCPITLVLVWPSRSPPVRLRGRVWVRIGSTNRQATPEEELRLSERAVSETRVGDLGSLSGVGIDDLSAEHVEAYLRAAVAPDVLEANNRSREQQLASLRMIARPDDPTLTVLGNLIAGTDPRLHIPGHYVQFVRFDGNDLTKPIVTQREIDGPLGDLLRQIDDVLSLNIQARSEFAGRVTEISEPDYPIDALRQLLRNAIMHRSYDGTNAPVRWSWFSDRVEIHSPGGPYGLVNEVNFGQPGVTDYRNPHLADAMKDLGYVQRFGAGIALARDSCRDNGNAEPEFHVSQTFVNATIRSRW